LTIILNNKIFVNRFNKISKRATGRKF